VAVEVASVDSAVYVGVAVADGCVGVAATGSGGVVLLAGAVGSLVDVAVAGASVEDVGAAVAEGSLEEDGTAVPSTADDVAVGSLVGVAVAVLAGVADGAGSVAVGESAATGVPTSAPSTVIRARKSPMLRVNIVGFLEELGLARRTPFILTHLTPIINTHFESLTLSESVEKLRSSRWRLDVGAGALRRACSYPRQASLACVFRPCFRLISTFRPPRIATLL
jgi:hypothetical protein